MVQKYLKFTESKYNKNKYVSFASLYQKNDSLRFKDDVCHLLDEIADSYHKCIKYESGYASRVNAVDDTFVFLYEKVIKSYDSLDDIIKYELVTSEIESITDCILIEIHDLPMGGHNPQFLDFRHKKTYDVISSDLDYIEKIFLDKEMKFKFKKLLLESLQRIIRLDKNITVYQPYDDQYSEVAIIFT